MHYAEFAEDEVRNNEALLALRFADTDQMLTNVPTESGLGQCHQGVREQQVEGHWPEGWQAGKGMRAIRQGALSRYGTPLENGAPQALKQLIALVRTALRTTDRY
jgi:hypothetical protein